MKSAMKRGLAPLALIALAFLGLNVFTPEYHDDFIYKFSIVDGAVDYSRPIAQVADIVKSQIDHYYHVNGRCVVHFLVQLFTGLLGKSVFNLFNAVAFAVFLFLLGTHLTRSTTTHRWLVHVLTAGLVLLMPRFRDTFLWMTGSVNYLWSATAVLFFLFLLEKYRTQRCVSPWMLLLLPAAVLCGWTHEGISLPLAIALLAAGLTGLKKQRDAGGLMMTVAFLAGACIAAFSPGTFSRMGSSGGGPASMIGLKAISTLSVLGQLKIIYLATVVSAWMWFRHRPALRLEITHDWYLLLAILLSIGVVFSSGMTSARTAFGVELFSLIYLLRLLSTILPSVDRIKSKRWAGVCLVALVAFYIPLMYHTIQNWQEAQSLISQIGRNPDGIIATHEHDAGVFTPFVRTMISNDASANAVNYDAKGWPASIAATYHRDSLVFLPQAFLDDLKLHNERYNSMNGQSQFEFYVQRLEEGESVGNVQFILSPYDMTALPFFFRPIARKMNRYTRTIETTRKWSIVKLYGNRYLLVKKDHELEPRLLRIQIDAF